ARIVLPPIQRRGRGVMTLVAVAGEDQAVAGMVFPSEDEQAHGEDCRAALSTVDERALKTGAWVAHQRRGGCHIRTPGSARSGRSAPESYQSSINRNEIEWVKGRPTAPPAISSRVH